MVFLMNGRLGTHGGMIMRRPGAGRTRLSSLQCRMYITLQIAGRSLLLLSGYLLVIASVYAAPLQETGSPVSEGAPQMGRQAQADGKPLYDESSLRNLPGNLAWQKKPSEQAFQKIFDGMPHDPRQRDYRAILANITQLCRDYPGSDAAYRCIFAVERWEESHLISTTDANRIIALKEAFNPARERLKALSQQASIAIQNRDIAIIHQIVAELRNIAKLHPGTVSEFVALGEIGPLYDSILDHANALNAVETFVTKYTYDSVDYPSVDTAIPANLLLQARLVSRTRSLDKGLERYRAISQLFSGRPQGLASLMEAGELALKNHREEEAITFFENIITKYSPDQDDRVVVARFRIAEANLKLGRTDNAVQLLQKIAVEMHGTRWEREANELITFAKTDGAILPVPERAVLPHDAHSTHHTKRQFYIFIVAGSVLIVLTIVSMILFRHHMRTKR